MVICHYFYSLFPVFKATLPGLSKKIIFGHTVFFKFCFYTALFTVLTLLMLLLLLISVPQSLLQFFYLTTLHLFLSYIPLLFSNEALSHCINLNGGLVLITLRCLLFFSFILAADALLI